MNNGQIKSKARVSAHGEVFTAERDLTERKMWNTPQTTDATNCMLSCSN